MLLRGLRLPWTKQKPARPVLMEVSELAADLAGRVGLLENPEYYWLYREMLRW